jgi:hypothetical protein
MRLGRLLPNPTRRLLNHPLPTNRQRRNVRLQIKPAQTAQLAATQTGRQQRPPHRKQSIGSGMLMEGSNLVHGPHRTHVVGLPRFTRAERPAGLLTERLTQHQMQRPQRGPGVASSFQLLIGALNHPAVQPRRPHTTHKREDQVQQTAVVCTPCSAASAAAQRCWNEPSTPSDRDPAPITTALHTTGGTPKRVNRLDAQHQRRSVDVRRHVGSRVAESGPALADSSGEARTSHPACRAAPPTF